MRTNEDLESESCGLFQDTIPTLVWTDLGKPRRILFRITGAWAPAECTSMASPWHGPVTARQWNTRLCVLCENFCSLPVVETMSAVRQEIWRWGERVCLCVWWHFDPKDTRVASVLSISTHTYTPLELEHFITTKLKASNKIICGNFHTWSTINTAVIHWSLHWICIPELKRRWENNFIDQTRPEGILTLLHFGLDLPIKWFIFPWNSQITVELCTY